ARLCFTEGVADVTSENVVRETGVFCGDGHGTTPTDAVTRQHLTTKPALVDVRRLHEPVVRLRFPVQREGIELVGEEDLGKSLIAGPEANARARRRVDPQPACAHMHLPVGSDGLQVAHLYVRTRNDRTLRTAIVGCLRLGRVAACRQRAFLEFE